MDHYDAKGRLLEEPDEPAPDHDADEAQEILWALHRWEEQARQWTLAYGDPDLQTQILERKDQALRDFTDWLRAFVEAQVERKLAGVEEHFAHALEAAIRRHRDTEWHR